MRLLKRQAAEIDTLLVRQYILLITQCTAGVIKGDRMHACNRACRFECKLPLAQTMPSCPCRHRQASMGRQLSEMGAAYADELEAIEGALLQVCIMKQ